MIELEQAKEICNRYDIISFEVLDTVFYSSYGETELLPRKLFYNLIKYLQNHEKDIRYSLRKSCPSDFQIKALKKFGFPFGKNSKLVYRSGEDLSFRKLRENNRGKRILHIGYGLANEFILPRCYGIDTYRFMGINQFDVLFSEKKEVRKEFSFSPDWKRNIEKKIIEKELISFDIFDTLLIRKTLYPSDVFYMTEAKALFEGYNVKGFAPARARAGEDTSLHDINQIYEWLMEYFDWTEDIAQKVQQWELETERKVLTLREEVLELLLFAQKLGKRVVLTSDMYLPESILRQFLTEKGIINYEKIFVSCDVKKSKHTGLYKELLQLCSDPNKILHIGDNPMTDGLDCESFGISSILIPSAFEMAKSRGWGRFIHKASNLMERCFIGLMVAIAFRNPFQNPNLIKCPDKVRLKRFGFCMIGPLAVGYLTWLIQQLQKEKYSGVLFLARDGWLFYNIYRKIKEKLDLPQPIYYYANRRSSFLCCMDSDQENQKMLEHARLFGVNIFDIFENVYQIPADRLLPHYKEESCSEYVDKHMKWINSQAEESRKGYLVYSERCKMVPGNRYALIDFFSAGTTQKYLSKFLPFSLKGFYFLYYNTNVVENDEIVGYLQNNNSLLLKGCVEKLEPFVTSMEPSQRCMSVTGDPIFVKEYRSLQELQDIEQVLKAAEEYSCEFFDKFYQEGQVISPLLIEAIYATEDTYISQHTIYDDWIGAPIRKREIVSGEGNDEN